MEPASSCPMRSSHACSSPLPMCLQGLRDRLSLVAEQRQVQIGHLAENVLGDDLAAHRPGGYSEDVAGSQDQASDCLDWAEDRKCVGCLRKQARPRPADRKVLDGREMIGQ